MRSSRGAIALASFLGWVGVAWVGGGFGGSAAEAKPIAPAILCDSYADAPVCLGGTPACTFCHTTPPARNAFGRELEAALLPGQARPLSDPDFASGLPIALVYVASADADGDAFTNEEEILAGTYPADPKSVPAEAGCPTSSEANGGFDVCNWDPRYVFRKVHLDFCGETLPYDRLKAFDQLDDKTAEIHAALDRCLDSEHWLGADGVLYRLAHEKIRPVQSIKSGAGPGDIPLGNYDDDYALFVWTQIDDHDAREVLTAQYFVRRTGPTSYESYQATPLQEVNQRGVLEAQLVVPDRRAGMLTTRWNFVLNTMFTAVPRTTAAQAYRAYLGYDIARMEGLEDVANEPADYDQKGVTAPACKVCHATLDPLTYPFTRYSGFNGGTPFSYVPNRMNNMADGLSDPLRQTPEAGVIFGQRVADLRAWAAVAASSDAFAKATVLDYWQKIIGELPRPTEQAEADALWRSFEDEHQYGVERMLHDLIMTEAYGVP
jgi:hypothetical protein